MDDLSQKTIFSRNLRRLVESKNLTQAQIASEIDVSPQTFNTWMRGIAIPRMGKIQKLADYFGVNKSDLIEDKMSNIDRLVITHPDLHPIRPIRTVPILGTIACGAPIWAEENFEGYIGIDPMHMDGEFALYCKGDSMVDAKIYDGDLVFFNKTPDVENGTIAAVLIENEATLKKVYKQGRTLILQPCNSNYTPIILSISETDPDTVSIIGECVGVYHVVAVEDEDRETTGE